MVTKLMNSISWELLTKNGCLNPYEKLGRSNLYDWFTDRREVKAKYAHLIKLNTRVQMRKWNLPILENYLVS
jgi:hypothetical protein